MNVFVLEFVRECVYVWVCICLCELKGCREREAEGKFEGMRITGLSESSASLTVD